MQCSVLRGSVGSAMACTGMKGRNFMAGVTASLDSATAMTSIRTGIEVASTTRDLRCHTTHVDAHSPGLEHSSKRPDHCHGRHGPHPHGTVAARGGEPTTRMLALGMAGLVLTRPAARDGVLVREIERERDAVASDYTPCRRGEHDERIKGIPCRSAGLSCNRTSSVSVMCRQASTFSLRAS